MNEQLKLSVHSPLEASSVDVEASGDAELVAVLSAVCWEECPFKLK